MDEHLTLSQTFDKNIDNTRKPSVSGLLWSDSDHLFRFNIENQSLRMYNIWNKILFSTQLWPFY